MGAWKSSSIAIMGNKNGTPVLREQDIAALSKSSGMDAAQVKEHFAAFLESHPNGKMKPKEFREMVEKTMPKSDASKMEKHVFRIYDSNNDGYIDFVEFMLIFHIMSDGTPEEVLQKWTRTPMGRSPVLSSPPPACRRRRSARCWRSRSSTSSLRRTDRCPSVTLFLFHTFKRHLFSIQKNIIHLSSTICQFA